ncbi:MAG TPA: EamA family transporter [Solirubrobacteraceae bacterium]|nr:EamA family transporter [Solirubrobacteraceae bacterium]
MLPVLLSLAASSCWGTADFLGGLQSKRVAVAIVLLVVEGTGLVGVLVIIAVTGEPFPGTRAVLLALVAGVGGVIALGCFYRALSIGTMSIVAPISATGVALPVVVGIATGDRLSTIVAAGLAVTVIGVVLASREHHDDAERASAGRLSVGLALVAAVGFGSYFVLSDAAADDSVLWLLALSRIIPVPALAVFAWRRGLRPPAARSTLVLAAAGTLDCGATALYGVANTKGALSIVAVVGSLYPVMTLVLARAVLGERIRPVQKAGVAAALAGVAMIAAG